MKVPITLFIVIYLAWTGSAQTIDFEIVLPLSPNSTIFEGVTSSSISFADIDGDNDQDVLITGFKGSGQRIAKLYSNDGAGNFIEVTGTPFDGVQSSSIAFADIDGDNDQDVLISGFNGNGYYSKLYTNDGTGIFTKVNGTPFVGVQNASIAFADIDGDQDQDVLITGTSATRETKLYSNDGSGNFTEVSGTPFDGIAYSSIDFSDIDGDNDEDVLLTGINNSDQEVTKLYTNGGTGNFTEVMGTPFEGVYLSSIAFSDIDGDNDQDVLITGANSSNQAVTKLYTNGGTGIFTEVTGTPFEGVYRSSIAFADIDGDNDQDVLITGINSSDIRIAKVYTNQGTGIFTEATGTPFEGVGYSSIAFTDIDGDNDQDVLITGRTSSQNIANLYRNITGTESNLIPEVVNLADLTGDCSVISPEAPTARDAFGTSYIGVADVIFPITDQSITEILWTYDDGNGNTITQTQAIIWEPIDVNIFLIGTTITANNTNGTYQWINCDDDYSQVQGETDISFTPINNGNYALEVTENDCIDTSACLNISTILGGGEYNLGAVFSVFPNPTSGDFTLEFGANYETSIVSITDITGRLIYSTKLSQTRHLHLSFDEPKGMYFVALESGNNKSIIKLVKE